MNRRFFLDEIRIAALKRLSSPLKIVEEIRSELQPLQY